MKHLFNLLFGGVFRAGFAGIEPVTLGLIAAGIGAAGGIASYVGTSSAQKAANKVALQQAAAQSAQSFYNTLRQQGINLQQLAEQFPDLHVEHARSVQEDGNKRDFQTWLYDHLRADPSHPLWDAIANPAGTAGAANINLPAWAVDANGNPLQPALLQQLLGINNGTNTPATAPVASIATLENARALLQARPEIVQELTDAGVGSDGRPMEQWLVDHITQTEAASGGGTFTDALRGFLTTPAAAGGGDTAVPAGPAGTGNNTALDPAITALLPGATNTLGSVFDGSLLAEQLTALQPVQDARLAEAAAQAARVEEQRAASGAVLDTSLAGLNSVLDSRRAGTAGIYDANVMGAIGVRGASDTAARGVHDANITKLAEILGVRREAAQAIYEASAGAATGLRDARTTGAEGIYGAERLQADTYNQAAQQALSRMLAEQTAERARRGFTGGGSGTDITRARLNADYYQRGAGARAQAGVNYQGRLSDAGTGYATDIGRAGIGRATTVGAANEADASAKLQAAIQLAERIGLSGVNYATSVGNAGVNRATSLAGSGEQDAIARLNAQVADATRRLGYLTADADIAKANADLKNAQDALSAITANQNRQVGSINAPFALAGLDLSLKGSLNDQQYNGLDALLKRLGSFSTTPAGGPALITSNPGAVLNGNQIAGGALTSLSSILGNTASNQTLQQLITALGASKPTATADTGLSYV